jgi:predicted nuclease with RNAse H fold
MEIVGIHLVQTLAHVGTPRRSVVARVDAQGRVLAMDGVADDAEVVEAVGYGPRIVVVDAPLAVPNDTGSRDIERVLAWCDIPLFPASRRRMTALHGGMRAQALFPALDARGAEGAWEASPDQVLRQLIWEREHPAGAAALELADYRAMWPGVRAPVYRPKAAGRARAAGLAPAWQIVASALDTGGWAPATDGDDWGVIADAARLDALCCALAGLRALGVGGDAVRLGSPERGRMVVPADANLRGRIELTLTRMRAEGAIRI